MLVETESMKKLVTALVLFLAACTTKPAPVTVLSPGENAEAASIPPGDTPEERGEIFRAAVALHDAGDFAGARRLFERSEAVDPLLGDHALRFLAEMDEREGGSESAAARWTRLLERFPASVWRARAALALAEEHFDGGDLAGVERWLDEAERGHLDAPHEARRLWIESRLERRRGSVAAARRTARELRSRFPGSPEARQAQEEAWSERETVALRSERDAADEASRLLREGAGSRALELVRAALDRFRTTAARAELAWLEAQALRRTGDAAGEERALAEIRRRFPRRPEAAQALHRLAMIAWNRDEDALALERFELYVRSYPRGPSASESLYAIGRVHQEAARHTAAVETFERLLRRYPRSDLAGEAAWRIGWSQYRAGDYRAAAGSFERHVPRGRPERPAALYWRARSMERSGRAPDRIYETLLREHPASYYAGLAEKRIGRPIGVTLVATRIAPPPSVPPLRADPGNPHSARFAVLKGLGLFPLARIELSAFERSTTVEDTTLLAAWTGVEGFREAVRVAARLGGCDPASSLAPFCYPLAFWSAVERESERFAIDPFLVLALMRQESLFDPGAVSPADARGLMQLLVSTAERTARQIGRRPPSTAELFDTEQNIEIGVAHLREVLDLHGGNEPRALAAYNAGARAVEKWNRRYGVLDDDEFVDSISYRETREYVKRVLQNRRIYHTFYGEAGAASNAAKVAPVDVGAERDPQNAHEDHPDDEGGA